MLQQLIQAQDADRECVTLYLPKIHRGQTKWPVVYMLGCPAALPDFCMIRRARDTNAMSRDCAGLRVDLLPSGIGSQSRSGLQQQLWLPSQRTLTGHPGLISEMLQHG